MSFFKDKKIPSNLKIPKIVTILMVISYFFSKRLTTLIASKLFTTPITFKRPKRELPMFEASQKKLIDIPKINKKIHVLTYGYSDKKVLLAHGWSGRDTQLFMIANTLLEHGFMVIAFDAPAHGKSTGKTTNLIEYIETIKEINEKMGPFTAAIGHSFGGMAILNTQAEKPIFKAITTIGSADKVSKILFNFSESLGLPITFGFKLITYFNKKWNITIDDYSSSNASTKINIPTLVVHDVLDGDVNVSCAINIRQHLKQGQLLITNGLGHTKILRTKEISNRIVNFIKENT